MQYLTFDNSHFILYSPFLELLFFPQRSILLADLNMTPLHVLLLSTLVAGSVCADLRILSSPDGEYHPAPCAVTCAGVGTQKWLDSGYHITRAYISVDLTDCGFTSQPIVIANVRAFNNFPNSHLRDVDQWGITVYTDEGITAGMANTQGWKLSWVAIGHVC